MIQLWCLHGNLQRASVWETTLTDLWQDSGVKIIPVDLWSTTACDFWDWARQFCDQVAASGSMNNMILGYSLGGRLAFHAVLQNPELWRGAISTNAHPGFSNLQDRQACLLRDQKWGQRFLSESWSTLLADWDNLPVFQNIPCNINREEHQFSRQQISMFFDRFSKGQQDDLYSRLQTLESPPILYLSGQWDAKYCTIGEQLARDCGAVEWVAIAQAAHRVPWENPSAFTQAIQSFLNQRACCHITSHGDDLSGH